MCRAISNALTRCSHLLHERTILVLSVMFCAGVAGMLWQVSRVQSHLITAITLQNAALYAEALAEFRTLYTSEVVETARDRGIEITHDYAHKSGAIPLPATLSMLLGERIGAHGSGVRIQLYSPYPFPWRRQEGGLRDAFRQAAWQALQQRPERPFYRYEEVQGRRSLRFATGDRMRSSCVHCHNTHPDSPKTDWHVGDVRGVLEVVLPLDAAIAQTRGGLRGTLAFMAAVTGLGLTALALVVGRLRRNSMELEQRAHTLQREVSQHAQTEQALAERITQVEVLQSISEEITRELDVSTLLNLITQRAVDLIWAATSGTIYLWDETTACLIPQAWHGRGAWIRDVRLRLGQGMAGHVAQSREGLIVNDYQTSRFATALFVERLGCTAVVAQPLLYRDRLVGVVALSNEGTGQPFAVQDGKLLTLFAAQAAIAIENARLYEDIRETRDFLRSIAENSADAIVTTDVAGRITYWTPGAEDLLGYRTDEALGLTGVSFYQGGIEEARAIMRRLRVEGRISNYETSLCTKDGRWVEVSSALSLLRDTSGARIGTLAVIKDITERKRAEQERLKLEQQMQQAQKLESLGVLAGGIAHDFNNLLTSILNNAGLAERQLAAAHPVQPHLREIVQGSKLASHLTGQLLAYAGKGRFNIRPLDLSVEIRAIEALLHASVRGKARLLFDLADRLPAIEADPVQVQQVLMNLVMNAAECTEGEVTIRIKTSTTDIATLDLRRLVPGASMQAGHYVALKVEDDGCGMDDLTKHRMFDPFFTTKATGHGLGLAATLGIIHGHGGGICVDSQPGAGTIFQIFLPASVKQIETNQENVSTDLTGHGVILVVDDDEYVRQVASIALQSFGYTVLVADDGHKALEIFRPRSREVALVILDLTMPGMGGEETLRALRALRPDVKVLLSTAFGEDETVGRYTAANLAGFLRKPYGLEQLAAKVKQLLADDLRPSPIVHQDEALHAVQAVYRQKLPSRLEELATALRAVQAQSGSDAALQHAHRLAHTLQGTVGSYGFDEIAAILEDIEARLKQLVAGERSRTTDDWTAMQDALVRARASLGGETSTC